MSPLLIALLGVLLVPLFVATWRTSLVGLAAQGFLMAWIAHRMWPRPTLTEWVTLTDLVLVRGLWAPLALHAVLRAQKAPARSDVIPPNLLSWTAALGIVVVAFTFAQNLVPASGHEQTLVAVATAGVLLGFLALATQSEPLGQMIGVLRVENAIALFELGGDPHHHPLPLAMAQTIIVFLTVSLYRWHLKLLGAKSSASASHPSSEPPH